MKSQFSSTCVNLPRTAFTHLLVFTIAALVCELGGADSTQRRIQFPSGYRDWAKAPMTTAGSGTPPMSASRDPSLRLYSLCTQHKTEPASGSLEEAGPNCHERACFGEWRTNRSFPTPVQAELTI